MDTEYVGRSSKGKLLCPLPHCGVEITAGTFTETDLKLQASIHTLQSEARRQQDWHGVPSPPTLELRSHKLLLLCCTRASMANTPPVFSLQHTPTNLINFPSRPSAAACALMQLCTLKSPHYFLFEYMHSHTLAIRCQFAASYLSEVCFKVRLRGIMISCPCFGV